MYPERTWKEILTIISGKNQKEVENPNGKYPIYGSGGIIGYANESLCPAHTVIIGRKGTIDKPIFVTEPFWNIDTAFGIVAGKEVLPKFLYFFCRIFNFKSLDKSTGRPSLAKTDLLKIKMPLPDLEEQARIVARIEELFSQLESGVDTLKQTKAQLAVYRLSVLKVAFEGRFTHAISDKTWRIIDFADVDTGATPLTSNPDYYNGEIAWVTSAKINDNEITTASDYITEKALKETNCKVFPPHTLLVAMYGEGKTRGKCAELMIPAATNQALAAIRIRETSEISLAYVKWFLTFNYQNIRRKAAGGVQPNLNLGIVKNIQVPQHTKEEQNRIVSEIESRLSVCDQIEQTVDAALQQAEALRQSILKKAFEGGL